jgi:septal ring factor EnvC (AmiA/AmiB activator)
MKKFLVLILFFIAPIAFANSTVPNNKTQLNQVKTQIQTLTTTLNSDKNKIGGLQKSLKTTDIAVGNIDYKLNSLNQQLLKEQKILDHLQAQRAEYSAELSSQQDLLAKQMRSAYLLSNQSPLKLMLNQQDPNTLSRMLHYYQYLNTARLDMIANINTTLTAIINNAAQIQVQTQALQQLKYEQQVKRNQLTQTKQQQQQVILALNNNIQTNQDKLQQLLANKKALETVITQLQQTVRSSQGAYNLPNVPFAKLQGRLPWPTQGKILKSYGSDVVSNSELKLNALIIGAPEGQRIYAVAPGKVVFANWLRGLGLLLIIDHGNGYMSLYGYNQSLYKKPGDLVKAGDLIATVGKSGGQQQDALYFGLRHDTTALNPQVWMKK